MHPPPLTESQKLWLLEQADQRDRLTDKALAEILQVTSQTVRSALMKLRRARRRTRTPSE